VGAAAGTGTAAGVGLSGAPAIGSTSGTGTATGVGTSLALSIGTAFGVGTADGISPTGESVGVASGTGTAAGFSIRLINPSLVMSLSAAVPVRSLSIDQANRTLVTGMSVRTLTFDG